jgi:hypothetical protein
MHDPNSEWTRQHLAQLWKDDEEQQEQHKLEKKKSKRTWNLHKRQGATPSTHLAPVSGGSRSRNQVEPTGETPTQAKTRSRNED